MNVAVVDLGTNTFNCCVVSLCEKKFKILLDFHEYPRLGEKGVAFGYISDEAMERGIKALQNISERIKPFNCQEVKLIGTSALRNANNANVFRKRVEDLLGYHITIIPGEQEAEYIFGGNNLALDWGQKTALILDIGGGSNECIICNHNKILWKHSFECGMQRIVSKFGLLHPLPQTTIDGITNYLDEAFSLLTEIIPQYSIDLLIGSAGAFDVFRSIYFAQENIPNPESVSQEIPINKFKSIVQYLCTHSIDEIESMKGMTVARAPLIPIAGCIADFFISKYNIQHLFQSSYSLKEGVIYTMMQ